MRFVIFLQDILGAGRTESVGHLVFHLAVLGDTIAAHLHTAHRTSTHDDVPWSGGSAFGDSRYCKPRVSLLPVDLLRVNGELLRQDDVTTLFALNIAFANLGE